MDDSLQAPRKGVQAAAHKRPLEKRGKPAPSGAPSALAPVAAAVAPPASAGLGTTYGLSGRPPSEVSPAQLARAERYAMQATAHRFLAGQLTPLSKKGGKGGKSFRLGICLRRAITRGAYVAVLQHRETRRARYGQLMRCGSGWTCPVCAAQITEHEREDIARGMDAHTAAGGIAVMVTITHSHDRGDCLAQQLELQRQALAKVAEHRRFKRLMGAFERLQNIRVTEITWGREHGWHPHIHDLLFLQRELSPVELLRLRRVLFVLWRKACEEVGLPLPSYRHGVDVKRAWSPAEYLAKWGRESEWGSSREMSKAHIKRGKPGRYTPFDFLRATDLPREQARALWREFAVATFGRRRVRWGNGLRAALGLGRELSGEEIVQRSEEEHDLTALIGTEDWRAVLRAHARARVLEAAEVGGAAGVESLLTRLRPPQQEPSFLIAPPQRDNSDSGEGDDTDDAKSQDAQRDEPVGADCQREMVNGADGGSSLLDGRDGDGDGCVLHGLQWVSDRGLASRQRVYLVVTTADEEC